MIRRSTFFLLIVIACVWDLPEVMASQHTAWQSYYREVGDTIFLGKDWYLKNPNAGRKVMSPDSLPFVVTDSSADSGIVWNEEIVIAYAGDAYHPQTQARSGTIVAIWYGTSGIASEVFGAISTDHGFEWGDSTILSPIDTWSDRYCNISGNDSLVFVVWNGGDRDSTYARRFNYYLQVWDNLQPVAGYLEAGDPFTYRPDVCSYDSRVFVTYEASDHTGWNQRFKHSEDFGTTWSTESVGGGVASGKGAEIAYGDGVVHVVRGSGGFTEVRYDRSTNYGDTWSSDSFISELDGEYSQWPSVAADPYGNVYATWFDYKDSPSGTTGYLFYRRSTDHGATWDPIQYLSTEPQATWSDIFADSFKVCVVWTRGPCCGSQETRFRMSVDHGVTWSEEIILNAVGTQSTEPEIDSDGSYVSVAWKTVKSGYYFGLTHKFGGK